MQTNVTWNWWCFVVRLICTTLDTKQSTEKTAKPDKLHFKLRYQDIIVIHLKGFGFEVLNAFKFKQWKPTTVKSWLFIMNEIILWPNICLIPDKTCQNVITKLVNLISLGCFEWKLNSSIFRGQVARKNYETKKWPGQTWKGIFREIFNI